MLKNIINKKIQGLRWGIVGAGLACQVWSSGSPPQHCLNGAGWHMPVILAPGRCKQENQLTLILGHTELEASLYQIKQNTNKGWEDGLAAKDVCCQAWWLEFHPRDPRGRRRRNLRQEDCHRFEVSLGYVRPCLTLHPSKKRNLSWILNYSVCHKSKEPFLDWGYQKRQGGELGHN